MPATSIKSSWSSGSLIFHEKTSYAPSTTYNVLTLGTGAVKVGDTANDVDFQYYGTGSLSWIIDCGAATLTNTGIAMVQKAALTVGVSGAGYDVTFYGDTAGCDFLWDQNGDTDGSLILGADTKGVDFKAFGATTGNYLIWDKSADDLLLVGTATQLAVAGTTESTSTTTGSLRTAGGLACVGDFYAGDDIFLTSGAVLNFNAGNVTLTHAANALTFATSRATAAMDDGYGMFEVAATVTGTGTGHAAASSSWLNIPSGTAAAGSYQCARNDGVYEDAGATITNAKIIFGARMQKILGDTDALSFPWSINTSNAGITALIDCSGTTTGDLSVVTNAGSDTGTLVPFCRDVNATKYIKLYDLA